MRVAVVPFNFPVFSETFVLNIVSGLLERGHEVDILPLIRSDEKQRAVHPAVVQYDLLRRTVNPSSVTLGNKRIYGPWALRSLVFEMRTRYFL